MLLKATNWTCSGGEGASPRLQVALCLGSIRDQYQIQDQGKQRYSMMTLPIRISLTRKFWTSITSNPTPLSTFHGQEHALWWGPASSAYRVTSLIPPGHQVPSSKSTL